MTMITPQEFMEGNKLIAGFMGWRYSTTFAPSLPDHWVTEKGESVNYLDTELKFHSSWDWLMPVVEKIESMNMVGAVVISRDHCWIPNDKEPLTHENEIVHADLCRKNKIDAVWYSVIQFIQWYTQLSPGVSPE